MDAQAQCMDSRIELSALPARRVQSGYKVAGIMVGLVGAIMTAAAMGLFYGNVDLLGGLCSPLSWVGIAILMGGLHLAMMGKVITLDQQRITVRRLGLLGRKVWSEPLAAYRGVRLRSKWESGGEGSRVCQVFLVELVHPDPRKTVVIFESRKDTGWHASWREMSIRFRLAAIEETPDGETVSTPDDLERTVREKVRQGAMEIAFDPSAPPPAGLSLRVVDGGLDIRVLKRNWRSPRLWGGLCAIMIAMVWLVVLLAWQIPASVVAVGAGLCALALAGVFVCFMRSQARLQVNRTTVTASLVTPLGERRRQALDAARISGVQIGAPRGQQGGLVLHILTDDGRVYFGAGLARPALEWLRNCLLAAVARLGD